MVNLTIKEIGIMNKMVKKTVQLSRTAFCLAFAIPIILLSVAGNSIIGQLVTM